MALRILKYIFFVLLALALGFLGLSLIFSDLGPGETWASRIALTVIFFFISGFVIGYFNSEAWWLSVLVSWGSILLVIVRLAGSPAEVMEAAVFLLPTVAPAILGGFLGGLLGKRYGINRLIRRLSRRT